jgi:hypothetical protein
VAGFEGGGDALGVALGRARDRLAALGHEPDAAIRQGGQTGIALVDAVRERLRAAADGRRGRGRAAGRFARSRPLEGLLLRFRIGGGLLLEW